MAIKVQRPGVEPVILRDLFIFRSMARFINPVCKVPCCNSQLDIAWQILRIWHLYQEGICEPCFAPIRMCGMQTTVTSIVPL